MRAHAHTQGIFYEQGARCERSLNTCTPTHFFQDSVWRKKQKQRLNKCDSSTSYSTNTEHHQYKTEEISHVDEEKRKHYNHSIYMMHKTWKCKQDTVKIL